MWDVFISNASPMELVALTWIAWRLEAMAERMQKMEQMHNGTKPHPTNDASKG